LALLPYLDDDKTRAALQGLTVADRLAAELQPLRVLYQRVHDHTPALTSDVQR